MNMSPEGYDLDAVKNKKCLLCDEPIGDNMFEEVKTLARFGTMLFAHVLCPVVNRNRNKAVIAGVKPV